MKTEDLKTNRECPELLSNDNQVLFFKQKYFTNNFYWVNKENYKRLQEIALEVGCLCHTGNSEIIEWHEGFKGLGLRAYEKNNNITVFQKEQFLLHNEQATDFNEMRLAYADIATLLIKNKMETLQIEKKNAILAYTNGGKDERALLENLFGKHHFITDICERVLTVEDACIELGKDYQSRYGISTDPYKQAETDIELFAEALREGKAAYECRYYPYFHSRSSDGWFSFYNYVGAYSFVGARLRVDTYKKAVHLGKKMIEQYKILDKG